MLAKNEFEDIKAFDGIALKKQNDFLANDKGIIRLPKTDNLVNKSIIENKNQNELSPNNFNNKSQNIIIQKNETDYSTNLITKSKNYDDKGIPTLIALNLNEPKVEKDKEQKLNDKKDKASSISQNSFPEIKTYHFKGSIENEEPIKFGNDNINSKKDSDVDVEINKTKPKTNVSSNKIKELGEISLINNTKEIDKIAQNITEEKEDNSNNINQIKSDIGSNEKVVGTIKVNDVIPQNSNLRRSKRKKRNSKLTIKIKSKKVQNYLKKIKKLLKYV